jgi:heterogeneous nuclear ribonucleoprotein K
MSRPFKPIQFSSPKNTRLINDHELRILMPSTLAGVIIGTGGVNVQRIRDENQAVVTIPGSTGPERVLYIKTADYKQTLEAFFQILQLVMVETQTEFEEQTVRILINQNYIGGLIGTRGEKIKKLRDQLLARVNFEFV